MNLSQQTIVNNIQKINLKICTNCLYYNNYTTNCEKYIKLSIDGRSCNSNGTYFFQLLKK